MGKLSLASCPSRERLAGSGWPSRVSLAREASTSGRNTNVSSLSRSFPQRSRDPLGLLLAVDGLAQDSPSLGGGEGRLEPLGADLRCEPEVPLGSVISVPRQGKEDTPRGHGAGVVVAAFDFVVRD